ncbi:MAG: helix-turn-helix transcriptional regulator [Symploca sp. SIO2E9]|nr:helix-turn-helix transcriptional regulator [Symploca sp. SIO2E9]
MLLAQKLTKDRICRLAEEVQVLGGSKSQSETAELLGVSQQSIGKWLNGEVDDLKPTTRAKVARALECTQEQLDDYLSGKISWKEFLPLTNLPNLNEASSPTEAFLDHLDSLPFSEVMRVWRQIQDRVYSKFLSNFRVFDDKRSPRDSQFFVLLEATRITQGLSIDEVIVQIASSTQMQLEEVTAIVTGERKPTNSELLKLGQWLKKPDGSSYSHEELLSLRDSTVLSAIPKAEE